MRELSGTGLRLQRGKIGRGLAWAGLLILMAWVPSCTRTEPSADGDPVAVAAEGDPIDGADSREASPPPGSFDVGMGEAIAPASSQPTAPAGTAFEVSSPALAQAAPASPSPASPDAGQSGGAKAMASLKSASPVAENGILPLSFAYLSSYEYDVPDPFAMKTLKEEDLKKISDQIPDYIKKLNSKKVALSGFMVPIDVVNEGVKTFILTYTQMMCCFGQMPWYNEWVYVEMPEGQPAGYHNDVPITVSGRLEVGEEIEDGFVVSLYRMKGEKVVVSGEPVGKPKAN